MPAAERIFIDSIIVLYALDVDQQKTELAWSLLFSRPCISLQVVNECSNVFNRKRHWQLQDVALALDKILRFVSVEYSDIATIRLAWKVQERYRFSYYGSLILAAALSADRLLFAYSEDMQHEQVIEGRLTIINPFQK